MSASAVLLMTRSTATIYIVPSGAYAGPAPALVAETLLAELSPASRALRLLHAGPHSTRVATTVLLGHCLASCDSEGRCWSGRCQGLP